MRSTRVRGHALIDNGTAYVPRATDRREYRARPDYVPGMGVGVCECDAESPDLRSDVERRRWHAEHKGVEAAITEAQPAAVLDYHGDTAAAMLAALMTCPPGQRIDTLAVVTKVLVEHPERFDRDHPKEAE